MKKWLWIGLLFLLLAGTGSLRVWAAEEDTNPYFQQAQAMETDRLWQSLPSETQRALHEMGVEPPDEQMFAELSVEKVLSQVLTMLSENSQSPLCGLVTCLGIVLLCALTEGFGLGVQKLSAVQNTVASVCICTAIIVPLTGTIDKAAALVSGGAGFLLAYVPILSGLMMSTGHEVTGTSYYTTMMTAGNAVSLVSAKLMVPLLNVFLALSVTSSAAPKMRLSSLCESVYKMAKWILGFVLSVFVAVLSLNTFVTTSMDQVSQKALRFTVSSFVPLVGGVLGEALNTFSGSLELLKSGAGVFVMIASAVVVLPVLLESILWQFSLFLLSSAADIVGLSSMGSVFKTVSKAAAMLTALVLSVAAVFIISTALMLTAAR